MKKINRKGLLLALFALAAFGLVNKAHATWIMIDTDQYGHPIYQWWAPGSPNNGETTTNPNYNPDGSEDPSKNKPK